MASEFHKKLRAHLEKLSPEQVQQFFIKTDDERQSYLQILNSLGHSLFAVDEEANITFANKAAVPLLGTQRPEGLSVFQLPLDESLVTILRQCIESAEKIHDEELTITRPPIPIARVNAYPLVREGHIEGMLFIVEDITEVKSRNLKAQHRESIQSLAALTAGIAHEIKNPLGALDLHLQLVNRFLKKKDFEGKDDLQELTGILNDELKRLDTIVNDFLFTLRPIRSTLKKGYLAHVVNETFKLYRPTLEQHGVSYKLIVPNNLSAIMLDKDHLKQALINLFKNALEAMKSVAEERDLQLELEISEDDETQTLVVSDNGPGMSKSDLSKIFQPFYSSRKMGTGLGLTIVYKIIQEHGAELHYESEPGEGTRAICRFPRLTKKQLYLEENRKEDASGH